MAVYLARVIPVNDIERAVDVLQFLIPRFPFPFALVASATVTAGVLG
jgi:hypothetical protein